MHGQMASDWQTAAAWVCIEGTVIMNKGTYGCLILNVASDTCSCVGANASAPKHVLAM